MTTRGLGIDFAPPRAISAGDVHRYDDSTIKSAIFSPLSRSLARDIANVTARGRSGNTDAQRAISELNSPTQNTAASANEEVARQQHKITTNGLPSSARLRRPKSMVELRSIAEPVEESENECEAHKASAPQRTLPPVDFEKATSAKLRKAFSQDAMRAQLPPLPLPKATLDTQPRHPGAHGLADFRPRSLSETVGLAREGTLLSKGASPANRSRQLSRLLAPASESSRAPQRSEEMPVDVPLEAAPSAPKARVELDVLLDNSIVVEGGDLRGTMEVKVAKASKKAGDIWMSEPKIRIVGFEELPSSSCRYIFFHHAAIVKRAVTPSGSVADLPCYGSSPDEEGFRKAVEGSHRFPFRIHVPLDNGAKGAWEGKQGAVRYIVICSAKVKSSTRRDDAIAHFYRELEVYPYYDPTKLLSLSHEPLTRTATKSVFLGGKGKVHLTASIHRAQWVAGQRCHVTVRVRNDASKKVKNLTLTLLRTINIFRPSENGGEPRTAEETQIQSTKKKVAETILAVGKKAHKRSVTARGLWLGVDQGEEVEFTHFVLLPAEAHTVSRGRYIEVVYTIRASVGVSMSLSDVAIDLPVEIINFVSLDPPPGHSMPARATVSLQHDHIDAASVAKPAMRVASVLARPLSHAITGKTDLNGREISLAQRVDSTSPPLSHQPGLREMETHVTGPFRGDVSTQTRTLAHRTSMDVLAAALAGRQNQRPTVSQRRSLSGMRETITEDESDEDLDANPSEGEDEEAPARETHVHRPPSRIASLSSSNVWRSPHDASRQASPSSLASPSSNVQLVPGGLYSPLSGFSGQDDDRRSHVPIPPLRVAAQPKQVAPRVSSPAKEDLAHSVMASTVNPTHTDVLPSRGRHEGSLRAVLGLRQGFPRFGVPEELERPFESPVTYEQILFGDDSPAESSHGASTHRSTSRSSHSTWTGSDTKGTLSPPELDTDSSPYSPLSLDHILTPESARSRPSNPLSSTARFAKATLDELEQAPSPPPKSMDARRMVLPSVRNRVAAFENRRQALHTFASTDDAEGEPSLARRDSLMSEAPSVFGEAYGAGGLKRMDSLSSTHFRAPLFRDRRPRSYHAP